MALEDSLRSHDHPNHLEGHLVRCLPSASCPRRGTVVQETAHDPAGLNNVSTLDRRAQTLGIEDSWRLIVIEDTESGLAAKIEAVPPRAMSGRGHLLSVSPSHHESAV